MIVRRLTVPALLLLSLAPAGCIDDPSTVDAGQTPITPEEAELLGVEIWQDAFEARVVSDGGTGAAADGAAAGLAAAVVPISGTADTTQACPDGGSIYAAVALAGEIDDETGAAVLDFSMLAVHRDCRESYGGQTFTLEGDPSVTMLLRLVSDGQGSTDLLGSLSGGIGVTADGRSGRCEMALAFSGRQGADGTDTVSLTGTVCGHEVDQTTSTSP